MSVRTAGAFLLVAAFLAAGALVVREKRARLRCLRDLCAALDLLRGELELHGAPLPQVFNAVSRYCIGAAKGLFQGLSLELALLGEEPFSALWSRAVRKNCPQLRDRELDELERLGLALGRYELSTQLVELTACRAFLINCGEEAERVFPAERRLWLGLCVSSGAMLAILLL